MGTCFGGFLVLAAVGGLFGGLVWWGVKAARAQVESALVATRRWGGRHEGGGWFASDVIWIRVDDVDGTLTWHAGTQYTPPYTRVAFEARTNTRLRVRPQGFFANLRVFFGGEDLQIGDPAFDPEFQIESLSVAHAKRILTPEARQALALMRPQDVTFDVNAGQVVIQVRRCLTGDCQALERFLERAELLLRACRPEQAAAARVAVVAVAEKVSAGCPVCSTPMDHLTVACTKCSTRHHPDCWAYLGGCSRYACGSKKARP